MRTLLALALVALPLAAMPASATCQVVTTDAYPDINYTTLCVLDEGSFTDSTQVASHNYVAHASHAVEADPAFEYAFVRADQGRWTYDDGEVQHERTYTELGGNAFDGVRGVAGGGAYAWVNQRDQTAGEDAGGACSSFVGRSTCMDVGAWWTVQDVASVGAGFHYMQTGSGDACSETYTLEVDAVVALIPVSTGPGDCVSDLPSVSEEQDFGELPVLP